MAPSSIDTYPSHPKRDLDDASHSPSQRALIGKVPNHWLHSAFPPKFDLSRPAPPSFVVPSPKTSISLSTTTTPIIISPPLTALVIVDMQNFFLSVSLGRPADGAGNMAGMRLLSTAIPAARKAGIRIVWLNWGLTDEDIGNMPPSILRAFGSTSVHNQAAHNNTAPSLDTQGSNEAAAQQLMRHKNDVQDANNLTENGKSMRINKGLGSEMGPIKLADGSTVDAGRLLMRDTWNASLPPALDEAYQSGKKISHKPDVWIHKNRMSGFWGSSTPCTDFLEKKGIRTLLFTGVNTDQCVGSSLQDAFTKGWDCVLLRDACGTTSPAFASECVEYNCARSWGFVCDCEDLEKGVDAMLGAK